MIIAITLKVRAHFSWYSFSKDKKLRLSIRVVRLTGIVVKAFLAVGLE